MFIRRTSSNTRDLPKIRSQFSSVLFSFVAPSSATWKDFAAILVHSNERNNRRRRREHELISVTKKTRTCMTHSLSRRITKHHISLLISISTVPALLHKHHWWLVFSSFRTWNNATCRGQVIDDENQRDSDRRCFACQNSCRRQMIDSHCYLSTSSSITKQKNNGLFSKDWSIFSDRSSKKSFSLHLEIKIRLYQHGTTLGDTFRFSFNQQTRCQWKAPMRTTSE